MSNRYDIFWDEMYNLAKKYYEHHGNLDISKDFKTNDGYTYDSNGKISLGGWLSRQRLYVNPNTERGKRLLAIGMDFTSIKDIKKIQYWNKMYDLAKKYYEHYGNLDLPRNFKTNDGFTYDPNGAIPLGGWIMRQRLEVKPDSENGKMLTNIGMNFTSMRAVKKIQHWDEMYNIAKKYYEHHGNLDISKDFKTNDGYTYDPNGNVALGGWVMRQRLGVKPDSEIGKKFLAIGMDFTDKRDLRWMQHWDEIYNYAKKYYEHHGNLDISKDFKTNDGYTYDPNGKISLGAWIYRQKSEVQSNSDKGKKLLDIGMDFTSIRTIKKLQHWDEMYNLAKKYYEHHGNLGVLCSFRTTDGFTYDPNGIYLGNWINVQKRTVEPTSEQGKKLLDIGMDFFNNANNTNNSSSAEWVKMYSYAQAYYSNKGHLYVPRDFKTNDGYTYDPKGTIELGKWIFEQRKLVKEGSKQWEKLNEISMVFDLMKDRKEKISFCIENGINYSKKNASIIYNTPMIELKAKLEYLKDTKKTLFKRNGEDLHRIFSMSDYAIQNEYQISVEEIIENYRKKIKR